jgi:hypothetical protein
MRRTVGGCPVTKGGKSPELIGPMRVDSGGKCAEATRKVLADAKPPKEKPEKRA